jgi:hypothetical protein
MSMVAVISGRTFVNSIESVPSLRATLVEQLRFADAVSICCVQGRRLSFRISVDLLAPDECN